MFNHFNEHHPMNITTKKEADAHLATLHRLLSPSYPSTTLTLDDASKPVLLRSLAALKVSASVVFTGHVTYPYPFFRPSFFLVYRSIYTREFLSIYIYIIPHVFMSNTYIYVKHVYISYYICFQFIFPVRKTSMHNDCIVILNYLHCPVSSAPRRAI